MGDVLDDKLLTVVAHDWASDELGAFVEEGDVSGDHGVHQSFGFSIADPGCK